MDLAQSGRSARGVTACCILDLACCRRGQLLLRGPGHQRWLSVCVRLPWPLRLRSQIIEASRAAEVLHGLWHARVPRVGVPPYDATLGWVGPLSTVVAVPVQHRASVYAMDKTTVVPALCVGAACDTAAAGGTALSFSVWADVVVRNRNTVQAWDRESRRRSMCRRRTSLRIRVPRTSTR